MTRQIRASWVLASFCSVVAYAVVQAQPASGVKVTVTPGRTWTFEPDSVTFDSNFSRARLNECELLPGGEFSLLIKPENKPINHSPWFAFKVSAARKRQVVLLLQAEGGSIRYRPKVSADGRHWISLPVESFQLSQRPKAGQGILTL